MKSIRRYIAVCFTMLAALLLVADTETIDGYTWTYRIKGNTAEIFNNYSAAISPAPTGSLVIPPYLGGKPVTSIMDSAFKYCEGFTSVIIPDSVTNIVFAFWGCSGLTNITIGVGIKCIGNGAFGYCTGLTSITIPSSVTSIGDSAFSGCRGLTNVTIPNGVTSIGAQAFQNCSGLIHVTIPDSVTSIEEDAFTGTPFYDNQPDGFVVFNGILYGFKGTCPAAVTIPNGITSIGYAVFANCYALTSVTIPDGVTRIGRSAFSNCRFETVTIPDSVTSIGANAFDGCTCLTDVVIPNGVMNIGDGAFSSCSSLVNIMIPDSVTYIGYEAFHNTPFYNNQPDGIVVFNDIAYEMKGTCPAAVIIPDGITSIGHGAFHDCRTLTSVTIPDSVTNIGEFAFADCSGLTKMIMPDNVMRIGLYALNGCSSLTNVNIPGGIKSIENRTFGGCGGLSNIEIPDGVTSIDEGAFENCSGLTSMMIPNSVTSIGSWSFDGCSGLTSVTIPNSVTSIGSHAFSGCSGLTSVAIPNSVTDIGYSTFSGCSNLNELFIPERFLGMLDWSVLSGCPADIEIFYYDKFAEVLHEALMVADSSETNIVLVVTNDCRVTFDWKCSCEPIRKGKMRDYLSFSIDGVQQDAICGEVDWTNCTFYVEGDGEHVLCWTYQKDASGSEGEDCGWVRLATVVPRVTLSFLPGDATAGEPPASLSFYADEGTVTLPGYGTLSWLKHTFLGWSNGTTIFAAGAGYPCDVEVTTLTAAWSRNELAAPVIVAPEEFYSDTATVTISAEAGTTVYYTLDGSAPSADGSSSRPYQEPFTVGATTTIRAIAVRDDYFDSPEATATVTKDSTTFGDAVNCPALEFTTDAVAGWRRVKGESPDGYALRSGVISHNATSRLDTVVIGEGIITFSCKVAGEVLNGVEVYDGLAFLIDGIQQGDLMGNADWVTNTYEIVGDGAHTLSWLYIKDESDEFVMPEDCAWLDDVAWVSMRKVTVSFDANGGELAVEDSSRRLVVNTAIGELPVPSRVNYTFLGWFTAADGGTRISADYIAMDNVTFYARWARIVRTITFDANGGVVAPDPVQVESGDAVGALPVPMRTDYVFLGWFTAADGGDAVTAETTISADITLYAHWRCLFDGSWTQGQDGSWRSGVVGNKQSSVLTTTVHGDGTVSFWCKVSSEADDEDGEVYDGLSFWVDGVNMIPDMIGGEVDWTNLSFGVEGVGSHTLEWKYEKDKSGSAGEDCAWMRGFTWTPSGVVVEMGGGKTVTVPGTWIAEHSALIAAAGGDAAAALKTPSANGRMSIAECYVVGLDPENGDATNDFRIVSFPMKADGTPDIEHIVFDPPQARWNVQGARAVIKGAAALGDAWQEVTEQNKASFRFFKVTVELP